MHKENVKIFSSAGKERNNPPLIRLYNLLVATELVLKDALPKWEKGHNLKKLIADVYDDASVKTENEMKRSILVSPASGAGMNSLVEQLNIQLRELHCTAGNGNSVPVDPDNYPCIRYIHFKTDFPADGTDNTQINAIINTVDDIHKALRKDGISI